MIKIGLVVYPPIDSPLPGQWRITAIDIFGDE
jgi:hypothetical protein